MTDIHGPATDEIKQQITRYIQDELLLQPMSLHADDDLLAGDLLDSMAVLRLATFVDEQFAIGMKPADFRVENFQTIAALTAYVSATRR